MYGPRYQAGTENLDVIEYLHDSERSGKYTACPSTCTVHIQRQASVEPRQTLLRLEILRPGIDYTFGASIFRATGSCSRLHLHNTASSQPAL